MNRVTDDKLIGFHQRVCQRVIDNPDMVITKGFAQQLLDRLVRQKEENVRLKATIAYLSATLDSYEVD